MNIKGVIAFGSTQNLFKKENTGNKTSPTSAVQVKKENNLPALAWKANRLPFASIKMCSDEFKSRMKAKIDRVKSGTQDKIKITKSELGEMKAEALKNISGPLVLKCDSINPMDLKALNEEFAKISNIDSLQILLDDPRIPDGKPLVISEPSSENFKSFIKDVDKANKSGDVLTAVDVVQRAAESIGNEDVVMPEITIRTSDKAIAKGLVQHIKAGLDYSPASIIASPFFAFKTGDELAIDLFVPVCGR